MYQNQYLLLDQIKNMTTDEIIMSYKNGYRILSPATITLEIVQGRGSVIASRNGATIRTINPGDGTVALTYNIGDTFSFEAFPDVPLGYSFQKFCGDAACTITTTTNPFAGTVTTETGNLFVYFAGTPATVFVNVEQGNGTVRVFRNTRRIADVTTKTGQTIDFFINDAFSFEAIPSPGSSFQKFCPDLACNTPSTINPLIGNISVSTGQLRTFFSGPPDAGAGTGLLLGLLGVGALGLILLSSRRPPAPRVPIP